MTIVPLADPIRGNILHRLTRGFGHAGQIAAGFAISQPAIYKHARLLTRAGLIVGRERI